MDLPRVTEILRAYSSYGAVPKDILEKAAARGTKVHGICAGLARGAWIPEGMIEPELIGYVNSFKQWAAAQVKKFSIVEKRYQNTVLGFTGQLDFVVVGSDDKVYLVDLKTSSKPQKTYPVQMAAYQLLLEQYHVKIKGAILVYLDKDGEFPNVHLIHNLDEERRIFISALECWNYFHKKKDKKNDGTKTTESSSAPNSDHGRT